MNLKEDFLDKMYTLWTKDYVGLNRIEALEERRRNELILEETLGEVE